MLRYISSALVMAFFLMISPARAQDAGERTAVLVVPIAGEVNQAMVRTVKKAVERARQHPRAVLVLEMDTFGGYLEPAYEISDLLASVNDITTIAYVKTKAISAGALIALSCQGLYMKDKSTIGDCAPLVITPLAGAQMAGEKVQSPLRAKFRALAQQNGYPPRLAEAMVTRGPALYRFGGAQGMTILDSAELAALTDSARALLGERTTALGTDQLLTMTDGEAATYGFSKKSVSGIDGIIGDLKLGNFFYVKVTPAKGKLQSAWDGVGGFEKAYWFIALPFTLLVIIMLVLSFAGFTGMEVADHHGDTGGDFHEGGHFLAAFKLFTVRNLIIFFAVFGWAGIAMTRSGAGKGATIGVSFILGLVMMLVVSSIFYLISRLVHSGTVNIQGAVGASGTVYVPVPPHRSGYGKVNVVVQGRVQEIKAVTDGDRLATGTSVKVLSLVDSEQILVEKT